MAWGPWLNTKGEQKMPAQQQVTVCEAPPTPLLNAHISLLSHCDGLHPFKTESKIISPPSISFF